VGGTSCFVCNGARNIAIDSNGSALIFVIVLIFVLTTCGLLISNVAVSSGVINAKYVDNEVKRYEKIIEDFDAKKLPEKVIPQKLNGALKTEFANKLKDARSRGDDDATLAVEVMKAWIFNSTNQLNLSHSLLDYDHTSGMIPESNLIAFRVPGDIPYIYWFYVKITPPDSLADMGDNYDVKLIHVATWGIKEKKIISIAEDLDEIIDLTELEGASEAEVEENADGGEGGDAGSQEGEDQGGVSEEGSAGIEQGEEQGAGGGAEPGVDSGAESGAGNESGAGAEGE
jgi:hypothetical protein